MESKLEPEKLTLYYIYILESIFRAQVWLRRTISVLPRTISVLCRTISVLGRTNSVLRRTISVLRRTDSVLRRTNSVLRRTISVLCRTNSDLRRMISVLDFATTRKKNVGLERAIKNTKCFNLKLAINQDIILQGFKPTWLLKVEYLFTEITDLD